MARQNTITGAEAHIRCDRLRSAEAALFHDTVRVMNILKPLKSCPARSQFSSTQLRDDGGDVVFLKEADGSDSGCAGFEAGVGVLQSYSAKGEDGDWCAAGLTEFVESGGCSVGGILFFEDWSEDGEGGLVGGGLKNFMWEVTGN